MASIDNFDVGADWRQQGTGTMNSTGTDLRIRSHGAAGSRHYFALQFDLSGELLAQGDDIDTCSIDIVAAEAIGGWDEVHCDIVAEDVDSASASGTKISDMAVTTALVEWDETGLTAGTASASFPDISTVLKEVVDRAGWDGTVNILFVGRSDEGALTPGSMASIEHATYAQANIDITYTAAGGNGAVAAPTITTAAAFPTVGSTGIGVVAAPTIAMTTVLPSVSMYESLIDVDSFETVGSGLNSGYPSSQYPHLYDLYTPATAAPAAGFPLIVFSHGGRWQAGAKEVGGENGLSQEFLDACIDNGYAVASLNYIKAVGTEVEAFTTWKTFPWAVHDIKNHLYDLKKKTDAATYDLDMDRVILTGFSAGGNSVTFAAMSIDYDDSTTYSGFATNMGGNVGRLPTLGHTRAQFTYNYDFDMDGNLPASVLPAVKGLFLWATPIDAHVAATTGPEAAANQTARSTHMGRSFNVAVNGDKDEVDINHYLRASNDTGSGPYAAAQSSPPSFPIGYVEGTDGDASTLPPTDDGALTDDAGVDALYDALNAFSSPAYDVSAAVIPTTNTSTVAGDISSAGLTRWQRTDDHGALGGGASSATDINDFFTWLEVVDSPNGAVSAPTITTTTVFPAAVGESAESVAAATIATTTVFPSAGSTGVGVVAAATLATTAVFPAADGAGTGSVSAATITTTTVFPAAVGSGDTVAEALPITTAAVFPAASSAGDGMVSAAPITTATVFLAAGSTGSGAVAAAIITTATVFPSAGSTGVGVVVAATIATAAVFPAADGVGTSVGSGAVAAATIVTATVFPSAGSTGVGVVTGPTISTAAVFPAAVGVSGLAVAAAPIEMATVFPAAGSTGAGSVTVAALITAVFFPAVGTSSTDPITLAYRGAGNRGDTTRAGNRSDTTQAGNRGVS